MNVLFQYDFSNNCIILPFKDIFFSPKNCIIKAKIQDDFNEKNSITAEINGS